MTMKCDKCIHKPVCLMRKQITVDVLEKMDQCCCYVEVDDPDDFFIKGDIDNIKNHPVIKAVKVEYTHVIYTPNTQVKAIPIKSKTLCERCFHYEFCKNHPCDECSMLRKTNSGMQYFCECTHVEYDTPCKYFKRKESGADNGK